MRFIKPCILDMMTDMQYKSIILIFFVVMDQTNITCVDNRKICPSQLLHFPKKKLVFFSVQFKQYIFFYMPKLYF